VPASIVAPFGPWEPAQPPEAAAIFAAMPCQWWIAGGFAIELAIGRPVRDHADIDVLVLRPDHLRIQQALHGWEWWGRPAGHPAPLAAAGAAAGSSPRHPVPSRARRTLAHPGNDR
jgi:hypothetical protein